MTTVLILCSLPINFTACQTRDRIIKIGNQAVLSGEYRTFGEDQLVSIALAVSKLSPLRVGGFDYKIEIVTKDDEGNPEKAFLAAKEMIDGAPLPFLQTKNGRHFARRLATLHGRKRNVSRAFPVEKRTRMI